MSVVLPTHQRAKHIARAMESVLSQDVEDLELIVIDDASTDDTESVVAGLRDVRVRYERLSQKSGASEARNRGIAIARAELVAFQDSDDEWLAGKLGRQLDIMARDPEVVVCYTAIERRSAAGVVRIPPVGAAPRGWLTTQLLAANQISTQAAVVKRSALLAVGGFDGRLPRLQDWDLWLSLMHVGPFEPIDEVLVVAHDTPGSITRDHAAYFEALALILDKHAVAFRASDAAFADHHWSLATFQARRGRFDLALGQLIRGARSPVVSAAAYGRRAARLISRRRGAR